MAYIGNDLRSNEDYKIIDDISSGFNGNETSFALQVGGATPVPFPKFEQQLLISVNGVIQEPDPTGSAGFKLSGTNIVFSSAPTNGHAFFGVIYAGADYVNAGGTFPDGSINFPSITFGADTNTGFTRTASGTVALISDGTKVAQFPTSQGSSGQALITDGAGNLSFGVPTAAFTDITLADSIIHSGDSDTKIRFSGADQLKIETAGTERVHIDGVEVVFNETGVNTDFRIEGDNNANLFKVDAGNDRVGIGTDTPLGHLSVKATGTSGTTASAGYDEFVIDGGNEAIGMCFLSPAANGVTQRIAFGDSNNNKSGLIAYEHGNDAFAFNTSNSERMRIDSSGRLLIGTTTNTFTGVGSSRLQVSGTGADTAGANFIRTSNDSGGAFLQFTKNRGAATQSGDTVGAISWMGHDGTDTESYFALISVHAEANASNNNTQGSIRFGTSNGSSITSERMRIDPAGRLLLGTTTEGHENADDFTVAGSGNTGITIRSGTSNFGQIFFSDGTSGDTEYRGIVGYNHSDNHMKFHTDTAERMRIDSSGRVGIGETSPATILHLRGTDTAYGGVGNSTTASGAKIRVQDTAGRVIEIVSPGTNAEGGIGSITNHNFTFFTSNTERARLMSGNLSDPAFLIGSSSNNLNLGDEGHALFYDGATVGARNVTGANAVTSFLGNQGFFRTMGDGDAQNTNNSYGGTSDETLKQDIVDAGSQWNDIKALKVRKFRFKDNPTGALLIGVVAQELETVSAGLVKTDSEGIKSVKYSVLYMKAVKCLQEAMAKIETLETKVAALEAA